MLDLLEEYTFPKPMPEDAFAKYHIDSDEAYLMLATVGTGNSLFRNWRFEINKNV